MKQRVFKGKFTGDWQVLDSHLDFRSWREAFDWAYAHATQHKEER